MRKIITIVIMVRERPFSIVEDDVWMWAFEYANPDFKEFLVKQQEVIV